MSDDDMKAELECAANLVRKVPGRIAQKNPKGYRRVVVREFEKDVFEILSIVDWHAWDSI